MGRRGVGTTAGRVATLTSLTCAIGPECGLLRLQTGRQGLAAGVGHDLTIEATRWSGSVTVDAERVDQSSVAVEVEVDSLVVREGTGGVKPLTDRDRADIHRTMTGRILDAARHPTITYSSAAVRATGGHGVVSGTLTIRGVERPLDIAFTVDESDPAVTRFDAVATVVQSLWGIRPYSGFFGALKLRDEVRVTVSLQLPAAR